MRYKLFLNVEKAHSRDLISRLNKRHISWFTLRFQCVVEQMAISTKKIFIFYSSERTEKWTKNCLLYFWIATTFGKFCNVEFFFLLMKRFLFLFWRIVVFIIFLVVTVLMAIWKYKIWSFYYMRSNRFRKINQRVPCRHVQNWTSVADK